MSEFTVELTKEGGKVRSQGFAASNDGTYESKIDWLVRDMRKAAAVLMKQADKLEEDPYSADISFKPLLKGLDDLIV
jgi:uncharacterized protein YccT (UPF0319 family)